MSPRREGPFRSLVQMATRVAVLLGSPIRRFGSSGLARIDGRRRKRWLMQVDEVLYLHAPRLRFSGSVIDVDADLPPDVDPTRVVRRRKLGIHMELPDYVRTSLLRRPANCPDALPSAQTG